jgi:uncharacterized HAD superfamily protein
MIWCIDIDGTLCENISCENEEDYSKAEKYEMMEPFEDMVEIVNALYDNGDRIVIHTARGMSNGSDLQEVTERQLKRWGVKYHELVMGKPRADFYVDDKAMLPGELIEMICGEPGDEEEGEQLPAS